jgi:chemosensory pili system protein ChpA (sensor histidine kinase/response regulator)
MISSLFMRFRFWLGGLLGRSGGDSVGEDIDPDVREVFFGELAEVAETMASLHPEWRANRGDPEILQSIRRGFHTLKGSGHMVGAHALGEFCGRIEEISLCLIERRSKAAPEMIPIIDDAIAVLPACSRSIRDKRPMPG